MKFTITDTNTGDVVAGLEGISEQHSTFMSQVRWDNHPTRLAVGESMRGVFGPDTGARGGRDRPYGKVERYTCTRTE